MLKDRAEFISRFLYRLDNDEPYSNPGAPPSPETIAKASASANDRVGFDVHRAAFSTLAVVMDACTTEELQLKGNGQAARNASKHPQVVALGKLTSDQRAAITVAALQGLAWMEDCRPWVTDSTLRNQIAKRVMAGIVTAVGRIKKAYSPAQLGALAQIGASLDDSDLFVLRSRGAIAEILAGNLESIPRDPNTISAINTFLERIADQPNAAPIFNAMDKLLPFVSKQAAARLTKKTSQWR